MTKLLRSLAAMIIGMAALSSDRSFAQDALTKPQRNDYGKIFKASKATDEERLLLLEAQETRLAVPSEVARFKKYIESFPSSKAAPVLGTLLRWNEIALDATALDSTNPEDTQKDPFSPPGPPSFFGEQYGPPRTSRVMAIVHLAMFEAVNTINPQYQSYKDVQARILKRVGLPPAEIAMASKDRAIVAAAYQTLVRLYPKKKNFFDNALDVSLGQFPDMNAPSVVVGALVGVEAANAVLALRYFDGSELPDLSSGDFDSGNPLNWHQDPISKATSALGGNWPRLKPFVIASGDAFRARYLPGPPAPGTPEYIEAYKMTKRLGGDPNAVKDGERYPTMTDRTGHKTPGKPTHPYNKDETFIGIFWAYDGSAYLCAPPRLYNMIATSVALKEKPITTVEEFSYYLAYINVTLADAAIVAWDGKFHYLFPRPITLLRDVKADDTPEGARDPYWTPLGAQATNGVAATRNITPPFPAYPSGHAVFGGSFFEGMQSYFKSVDSNFPNEGVAFDFVSDEYNGKNSPPGDTTPRAKVIAHFDSFKDAEKANADSRIYLGVHWKFDVVDGTLAGNAVGRYTAEHFVKPIPKK